ncbi:hypothetical protein B566_EDAN005625 [Ephemera danica]|nr:hypothetical protein B566_EDAN005625 [Ephemera danica]
MEMKQFCRAVARLRSRLSGQHARYCGDHVAKSKEEIVIPPRIERGPTDILRALSSTVSRDITAPHYKYHDDPFLIPSSNIGKRTFALAKESGRKAAQWIHQQHGNLFDTTLAQPPIPALMPRVVYKEDTPVSEAELNQLVRDGRVEDAITVMQLLEKQQVDVSLASRQSLLELLCFHNCEEPVANDLVEERWFRQGHRRERQRKTWRDGGYAEQLFASIQTELEGKEESQAAMKKSKCALIRGMNKYGQVDRAWELYQGLKSAGEKLDCGTFDTLLKATGFLKDGYEERWQLIEDLLKEMAAQKVTPGLGTLNAVLEVCSTMGNWRQTRSLALRCLAEFKQAGVAPSLASYYFLLTIYCRERGPTSNILEEIMNELEGKDLSIRDTKDTFFFVTAMDVCRNHLGDPGLARRLHSLLLLHNNYDLIGDSYKESIYYRHFFTVICTLEPLESFMQVYNKYVPHVYIPEPSVMEEIVRSVELHEAWDLLPRLWSDILIFDQVDRLSLVSLWLHAAVTANQRAPLPTETAPASTLAMGMCKAAAQLWDKIDGQSENRTNPIRWTGPMLGDALHLAIRAQQFPFAVQILSKLREEIGTGAPPSLDALREFLNAAVTNQDTDKALMCVEYTIDAGFPEAAQLASELKSRLQLSENQQSRLTSMLGI